jgi:hypothetical protein
VSIFAISARVKTGSEEIFELACRGLNARSIDKAVAGLVDRVRARRREMTVGSARDGLAGMAHARDQVSVGLLKAPARAERKRAAGRPDHGVWARLGFDG